MTLTIAVLAAFALAPLAPALARLTPRAANWLLALLPAALTATFASLLARAAGGNPLQSSVPWAPQMGLNLAWRADGLSLLFALLISGVGTLVLIYAGGYLKGHPALPRFYFWLLIFMGAMLGVALADNLLLLYVFWELTSLSSYALIGFEHEREPARSAALQALLVTSGGGLAMLAGFVLVGQAAGTLDISALAPRAAALQSHPLYLPALALILLGAFTKSAQFPFHFWLPNAMEAPTPVSAYLHSATMVKAGVYLLARLSLALGGTVAWQWIVGGVGLATMVVATYLALLAVDLKRLLAYATVSALGLLVLLLGIGGEQAQAAALVYLLGHALYKGALFLVAGSVDHETGTRDVTRLGGLRRAMPITAAAALVAALSLAGAPPLLGFIGKELAYETALGAGPWIIGAVVAAGMAYVFVAGQAAVAPFWGPKRETPKHAHEAPASMWLGPALLAGLGLLFGLWPGAVDAPLLAPAVAAVSGRREALHLALWHGVTPALVLSLGTLAAGVLLYWGRRPVRLGFERLRWPFGPAWAYVAALRALNRLGLRLTRWLQSGYLRSYLLIISLTMTGLGLVTLAWLGGATWPRLALDVRFYEAALAVLILSGAAIAVTTRSRLGAVAALGTAGYGVALIFLVFGAPDLAMTQFMIESLTVILFVLVFYHLPRFAHLSSRRVRVRDILVAGLAGTLMTALVLVASGTNWYPSIQDFFVQNAYPAAHGRNIVNVILVDFRGFDTLGEITVLSIAGMGVYALFKIKRKRPDQ
jgi:multicomponent Na+:H+ antiporter subunit A